MKKIKALLACTLLALGAALTAGAAMAAGTGSVNVTLAYGQAQVPPSTAQAATIRVLVKDSSGAQAGVVTIPCDAAGTPSTNTAAFNLLPGSGYVATAWAWDANQKQVSPTATSAPFTVAADITVPVVISVTPSQ